MSQAAGWIGKLPLGPVCLQRIKPAKPGKTKRRKQAVRIDEQQLELNLTGEKE